MKLTTVVLILLVCISACGKKEATTSVSLPATQYMESPGDVQAMLKDEFQTRDLQGQSDGYKEAVYIRLEVHPFSEKFRGQTISRKGNVINCTHFLSTSGTTSSTLLSNCGKVVNAFDDYDSSYGGSSGITIVYTTGQSNLNLSADLSAALYSEVSRVAIREVTYLGKTYSAFGVQISSGLGEYTEYVLVPEIPRVLNPVLQYQSGYGYVTAIEGIVVK